MKARELDAPFFIEAFSSMFFSGRTVLYFTRMNFEFFILYDRLPDKAVACHHLQVVVEWPQSP